MPVASACPGAQVSVEPRERLAYVLFVKRAGGQHSLTLLLVQQAQSAEVVLVKNWFEELAAKTRPKR
jgi:hypothetical protein